MPFNHFLWNCLRPGKGSYEEQGKGIRFSIQGDETFLMFTPDNPVTRKTLKVDLVCDIVAFYKAQDRQPVVFLVELKGSDHNHAADQIESTFKAMCDDFKEFKSNTKILALIVSSSSAPSHQKALVKRFNKKSGIVLHIESGVKGNVDIRKYITK